MTSSDPARFPCSSESVISDVSALSLSKVAPNQNIKKEIGLTSGFRLAIIWIVMVMAEDNQHLTLNYRSLNGFPLQHSSIRNDRISKTYSTISGKCPLYTVITQVSLGLAYSRSYDCVIYDAVL